MKKQKFAALFSAAVLTVSAAPLNQFTIPVKAADTDEQIQSLPEWIPHDSDSASIFRNQYGMTHIADRLLCTVFVEEVNDNYPADKRYQVLYESEYLTPISSEFYSFEGGRLRVDVYQPIAPGDTVFCHEDRDVNCLPYEYQFHIDNTLNITETDLYRWAPDCQQEFLAYSRSDKQVVTRDGCIMFCMESSSGTGCFWEEENDNPDAAEAILRTNCTRFVMPQYVNDGDYEYQSVVYGVLQDGEIPISMKQYPPGSHDEPIETLGGIFYAADNCKTVYKPGDARITLLDADTGNPVIYPFDQGKQFYIHYQQGISKSYYEDPVCYIPPQFAGIASNSCIIPIGSLFALDHYSIWFTEQSMPEGYSCNAVYQDGACDDGDAFQVTMLTDEIADITVKIHFAATGDFSNDGAFSMADAVMMQRWLHGDPDVPSEKWKSADFVNDNRLDARDYAVMKQKLIARAQEVDRTGCLLTVTSSYSGFGVAGQDLGHGSFQSTFWVLEGDRFYESENGIWHQNIVHNGHAEPILTIKEITAAGITVEYHHWDGDQEQTLEYGEESDGFPYTFYVIFDGINYSYSISFAKRI